MEIGGASIRWRWFVATGAVAGMVVLGGCGSSGGGGTGGAGGHGGALGGAGGHGGTGGAGGVTDGGVTDGVLDARGGTDGGVGDGPVDAPPVAMLSFTFDSDLNGFDIDPNPTTNPVNLGALSADGGAPVTLTFDGSDGMPAPGSARVDATFSDYDQVVAFRHVYPLPINLTGATLTARVRLDAGPDGGATTFSGIARVYALSTTTPAFYLAEGGTVNLNDNAWHTMTFHLTSPEFIDPSFDPTSVVQLGVHLATPPPVTGDAAVPPFGAPQAISVHIDTLTTN